MEQKFSAKKLLSILIVLTMLFTSLATFMVPVSAAEYAAGLTVEVDGEQVSWLGGYTLDEVEALLSNGDAYTTPTGGSTDWNAGGGVVAMQNLKCADSTIHPEINLIWNFEEATEIDTVDLGLYAVPNSMIGFPETEIAVAISDDGAEWTSAGTIDTGLVVEDTSNNTGFTETVSLTLAEAVTTQYIKLTLVFPDSPFTDKPVWEFVGLTEVAFSKSTPVEPTNVALNKTYTTHDPLSGYNALLTDGVKYDAMAYSGDHWFAFKCNPADSSGNLGGARTGSVVINLGAAYDISEVKVNAIYNDGAGVSICSAANVYFSADGENWSGANALTIPAESTLSNGTVYSIEGTVSGTANYVKVEMTLGAKTFLFFNEIEVYGVESVGHTCMGVGEWQTDETNHWKLCECGEKTDEGAHDEGTWVVTTEPEIEVPGEETRKCTVCGYALETRPIDALRAPIKIQSYDASDFGAWVHWTYDTSDDGVKLIDGNRGYNGISEGSIGWYFNKNNTTEEAGGTVEIVFTLDKEYDIDTVKGYFYHYSSYLTADTFTVSYSVDGENYTAIEAEAVKEGETSYTLTVTLAEAVTAKYVKVNMTSAIDSLIITDEIEVYGVASTTEPPHECVGEGDWQSDETNHWKVCECGEKTDEGAHDEGTWVETTPAEVGVPGEETRKCNTCGYALETRPIDALPQPILPPEDADKSFTILTNGGFALADCTIFVRLGDLTTIGEVAGSLRGIEATADDVDYNYYGLILVDADGNVVETNFNLGRDVEGGKKNEVVIPEGGYALLMHADNADYYSHFASIEKDDTIVLTNVDLEALAAATEASDLTDAYASLYKAPEPPLVDGELVDIDSYTTSTEAAWYDNWSGLTADDGEKLINGLKGANGFCEDMVGWYYGNDYPNGGNVEINLTLKELSEISDIAAYFYHYNPTGYNSASEMQISVSVDGENYVPVTAETVKTALNELAYPNFALTVALEEAVIAKYVKIVLPASTNSLVIIDEVEVYGTAHTCVAGEAWESDETNHWNVCACGEKMNEGAHDEGIWVETTPAEIGVPGEETRKCTACGYALETRPIDALPEYELGDVNGDGDIDSVDYLLVKRDCFNTYELTEEEAARADVNGDEKIDSTDYILIKRIIFGTYEVVADDTTTEDGDNTTEGGDNTTEGGDNTTEGGDDTTTEGGDDTTTEGGDDTTTEGGDDTTTEGGNE